MNVCTILFFPLPVHPTHHPGTRENPSSCYLLTLSSALYSNPASREREKEGERERERERETGKREGKGREGERIIILKIVYCIKWGS